MRVRNYLICLYFSIVSIFVFVDAENSILPSELLQASNVQITAPYIYGMFKKKNIQSDWGYRLYTEYFKAMHKQKTGFDLKKDEIASAVDKFDTILSKVKSSLSDTYNSSIVIDESRNIVLGFEEAAACLLYDKRITCEIQHESTQKRIFFHYLKEAGFEQKYLDAMAFEYLKLNQNARIAVIWPSVIDKLDEIKRMFSAQVMIVYEKDFELKNNGPKIFLQNLPNGIFLKNQELINYFSRDIQESYKLSLIILEANEVEKISKSIFSIREVEKDFIYICDTHDQSIEAAGLLLNDNSIHFMNYATTTKPLEIFNTVFLEYKRLLQDQKVDVDDFCIEGSSVLALYGIRESNDLDFICRNRNRISVKNNEIKCHNGYYNTYFKYLKKDDVIFNPENHFNFQNIKVVSIFSLKKFKEFRKKEKDIKDIELISDCLNR